MSFTQEDICQMYGVCNYHFMFGSVGNMVEALTNAHNNGFIKKKSENVIKDGESINNDYDSFIKLQEIGIPNIALQQAIISAGLNPNKLLKEVNDDFKPLEGNNVRTLKSELHSKLKNIYDNYSDEEKVREMERKMIQFEENLNKRRKSIDIIQSEKINLLLEKFKEI